MPNMRDDDIIDELLRYRLKLAHSTRLTQDAATRFNAIHVRREMADLTKTSTWNKAAFEARREPYMYQGCCVDPETGKKVFELGCWAIAVHELCACWIARPQVFWDEDDRRHRDDGPAVTSDVGSWYYFHGVEVPGIVIMKPELITQRHIDQERNEEVRRVMIERWPGGWERWLRAQGEMLDSRRNDRDAQREALYSSRMGNRLIVSDPSTGRRYALGVPRTITTCEEAQLWLSHGLDRRAVHRS